MRMNAKAAAAVMFSAVLQTVIFPVAGPMPQWRALLAWIALVPWLWLLLGWRVEGWRDVQKLTAWSYACGILWYLGNCYWVFETMHQYGGLSWPMAAIVLILFCFYLGLYHALFGLLIGILRLRLSGRSCWMTLVIPIAWVAVELARARVTSFPWNLLGYSQIDNAALTMLAPWAGTYALSFLLAFVNAGLAVWMVSRSRFNAIFASGAAVLAIACGAASYLVHPPLPPATQAALLIQPNFDAGISSKRSANAAGVPIAQQLADFSKAPALPMSLPGSSHANPPVSLVLWPEEPVTYDLDDPEFRNALQALSLQQHSTVIADAVAVERDSRVKRGYRLYNSASLFTPTQGFVKRYDKIHLVPFGEFMPYESLFAFASGLTQQVGLFDHGRDRSPLPAGPHRYGTFICYESIFADEIRQFALDGADVLINLSDDGWYGDSSAPFQHINMARMRAIENRRWLIRDTNNGITASIDPYGTVREWAPRNVQTSIVAHFDYASGMTFYTRHGDWFAYTCAAITVALLAGTLLYGAQHLRR